MCIFLVGDLYWGRLSWLVVLFIRLCLWADCSICCGWIFCGIFGSITFWRWSGSSILCSFILSVWKIAMYCHCLCVSTVVPATSVMCLSVILCTIELLQHHWQLVPVTAVSAECGHGDHFDSLAWAHHIYSEETVLAAFLSWLQACLSIMFKTLQGLAVRYLSDECQLISSVNFMCHAID